MSAQTLSRLNLGPLLDNQVTQKHVLTIVTAFLESRTLNHKQVERDLEIIFPNPVHFGSYNNLYQARIKQSNPEALFARTGLRSCLSSSMLKNMSPKNSKIETLQFRKSHSKFFNSDVRSQNQSRDSRSNSPFDLNSSSTPQRSSEVSNDESDGPYLGPIMSESVQPRIAVRVQELIDTKHKVHKESTELLLNPSALKPDILYQINLTHQKLQVFGNQAGVAEYINLSRLKQNLDDWLLKG